MQKNPSFFFHFKRFLLQGYSALPFGEPPAPRPRHPLTAPTAASQLGVTMGRGGWDSGGKCEGVSLKLTVMPVQQLQVHEKKNCFSFFKKKTLCPRRAQRGGAPTLFLIWGPRHPNLCEVGLPSALHTRSRTHPPTKPRKTIPPTSLARAVLSHTHMQNCPFAFERFSDSDGSGPHCFVTQKNVFPWKI